MNIYKGTLLIICTLLCTAAFGKKHIHKTDTTDYTNLRLRYFFIEPISLIDVYNGSSIRLGTEYSINKHYAANVTLGTYWGTYYLLKLEMKRYVAFRGKERYYLSLQYFYKHTDLGVVDNSKTIPKGSPGYDINYNVNKYASFINVNAGLITFHKHHIIIDGYCGVGLRYHTVTLEHITPAQADDRYHSSESAIDDFTNNNDKGFRLNISLGMRFGFRY